MSNGKIDLWNLDQAMRDVPLQGFHPDVITALVFLDDHQLLLSADDSGSIKAWFVRPSRWKGQLAFELHTPPTKRQANGTTQPTKEPIKNDDPIRQVTGLSLAPGISSMGFHAPSSRLFCGHRNGTITVWHLQPLIDFLARVSADASSSWFVTPSVSAPQSPAPISAAPVTDSIATHTLLPPGANVKFTPSTTAASTPLSTRPSTALLNPIRAASNILGLPESSRYQFIASNLPIKDQLALMASALKPSYTFQAHDTIVATLHVIHDPPALLSTAGEHVAQLWTLNGDYMGVLDSVQGMGRAYAASSGVAYKGPPIDPWEFSVNVAAREQKDRATTHAVLQELEQMSLDAEQAQIQPSPSRIKSRPNSSNSLAPQSSRLHSRAVSTQSLHAAVSPSTSSNSLPPIVQISPAPSPSRTGHTPIASSPTHLSRSSTGSRRPSSSARNESDMKDLLSTPQSAKSPQSPGNFFLSTPLSPIDNYNQVTKGLLSPASRSALGSTTPSAGGTRPTSSNVTGDASSNGQIATPTRKPSTSSFNNTNRSARSQTQD